MVQAVTAMVAEFKDTTVGKHSTHLFHFTSMHELYMIWYSLQYLAASYYNTNSSHISVTHAYYVV
jgi:hypothetical protein